MGDKKEELIKIIGDKNVFDGPETLDTYSRDYSFVSPRKPRFVVKAKNADGVQKIVEWANLTGTPMCQVATKISGQVNL